MKKAIALVGLLGSSCAMPMENDKPDFSKSSDDKAEAIPYKVLETNEELGFEVREYPASKWFCSEYTQMADSEDPFANWQESGVTGNEVMASSAYEARKDSKTFMKLFKYILGVNEEGEEIEMTRPVTTKITLDEATNQETHRMCFWSGTPWAEKTLPTPYDKSIEFEDRPEMQVFVRQFSGWAISDNEWEKEMDALETSLVKADVKDVDESAIYAVGYDGPWTQPEDRRNEIWMAKTAVESADNENEELPYEVVMTNEEFELRKYPKSKWVCTKTTGVDGSEHVLNGWQKKYPNATAAWQAKKALKKKNKGKKESTRSMWKKLYLYISGVNLDFAEIDMTSPVPTSHTIIDGTVEDQEKCFWSGTEWEDKELPKSPRDDVHLDEKEEFFVYVKQFGGYAFSYDDWQSKYNELKVALGDMKYRENEYITVGYQSPWSTENRRNEIWIPVPVEDIDEEYLSKIN